MNDKLIDAEAVDDLKLVAGQRLDNVVVEMVVDKFVDIERDEIDLMVVVEQLV